jgi:hypothetical protein
VEYRLQQTQKANDSASLADKFPKLKSLTADLAYFDDDGMTKNAEMRYKVNVQHAKSLFWFGCPRRECVGGDFDLSTVIAEAVASRLKIVEGQLQCQGSHVKPKQEALEPCHYLLRYKLSFAYV